MNLLVKVSTQITNIPDPKNSFTMNLIGYFVPHSYAKGGSKFPNNPQAIKDPTKAPRN